MRVSAITTEEEAQVFLLRAIIRGVALVVVSQMRDANDLADYVIDLAALVRSQEAVVGSDNENESFQGGQGQAI